MGKTLVTSALIYANGDIHLGHVAGAYLPADIYVRYLRLKGEDVLFISGTDEHGVPITLVAEKQGKHPREVVDYYFERIDRAFREFGMSWDHYSRTSRPIHYEITTDFFKRLHEGGFMVEKTEQQHYSVEDKRFLPDRYVIGTCPFCGYTEANGTECESCGRPMEALQLIDARSKLSGQPTELRDATHLYLRLDQFQKPLEDWLAHKTDWKENVLRQTQSVLKTGLRERAVTRDLDWGIPVPVKGYEHKVIYVWLDAPIGYISATVEWAREQGAPEKWREYWQNPDCRLVHFIGKDNIFFHTLQFPATLMGYNQCEPDESKHYILVDNVPANEYLNFEGLKFSTSKGHGVWLKNYLEKFNPDPLRYYLTANMPELRDADFTWPAFQQTNNSELSGNLGNFTKRVQDMTHRYFEGKTPARGDLDEESAKLVEQLQHAGAFVGEGYEQFRFRLAADRLMKLTQAGNIYLNQQEPWKTAKSDPAKCGTTLHVGLNVCAALALLMEPILPFGARRLWEALRMPKPLEEMRWSDIGDGLVPDRHEVGPGVVLFPNIPDEVIQEQVTLLEDLKQEQQAAAASQKPGNASEELEEPLSAERISIDDFRRLDLRVAEIVAAEKIKKADKLLKLTVKVGPQERTLVAGLAKHYAPEDLVGRKVVIAANLEPAKIRGVESNGMVLAAADGEQLFVLDPGGARSGSKVE